MGEEFAVGIDLGTSNSCVVVYRYDRLETIAETSRGARAIPSCIAFDQTGPSTELLFGIGAKNHQKNDPHHCVYNVKRIIGKQFDDKDVQMEKGIVPYGIVNEDGYPRIRVEERGIVVDYSPEEISSMVLSYLKRTTEEFLGSEVKSAVITVPANFNDAQRKATKLAAEMAGLKVLRMLNEPTAAAMAYGADLQGRQNLLVFDFGGGTLDVSILEVQDATNFRVKATAGNMRLGGEDIDQRIVTYMLQIIREKHNFDASRDDKIKSRLRYECEEIKRQLSASMQKRITIPNLLGNVSFTANFTRAELERLCADLFERILEPVDEALRMAQMTKADISHVILVGGSSHIPKVRELLGNYFPNAPLRKSIDPSEAVAKGAALLATSIASGGANLDIQLEDVTPLTLGVNVFGGDMSQLIPKGSPLPTENHQVYTTFKDKQEYIDIDVFEGEHPKSKQNHYLGNFKFSGIRPAPKGKPNILINFSVDLSGILTVTACEGANKMSMVFRENKEPPMAIGSSPPNNTNTAQARSKLQREVERARRDVDQDQDEFRQIRVDLLAKWLDATKDLVCPLRHYERWSRILQVIFQNALSSKTEITETAIDTDLGSPSQRTESTSANAKLAGLSEPSLPSGRRTSAGSNQSQHENLTLIFSAEADVKYCESPVQDRFKSTIKIFEDPDSAPEKFLCVLHSKTQKELFFVRIEPGMITPDSAKFHVCLDNHAALRIQFTTGTSAKDFANWTQTYSDIPVDQIKGGSSSERLVSTDNLPEKAQGPHVNIKPKLKGFLGYFSNKKSYNTNS